MKQAFLNFKEAQQQLQSRSEKKEHDEREGRHGERSDSVISLRSIGSNSATRFVKLKKVSINASAGKLPSASKPADQEKLIQRLQMENEAKDERIMELEA